MNELKIYEKIGIKKFRKLIFKLINKLINIILFYLPKEERNNLIKTPSNYYMKKGNGIYDVLDFKYMIYLNSIIHLFSSIYIIFNLNILNFLILIINFYCLILQRYNYIRIKKLLKKHEQVKLDIVSKISNLDQFEYQLINEKKKIIDFNNIIDNLDYKELLELKKLLSEFDNNQVSELEISNVKKLKIKKYDII